MDMQKIGQFLKELRKEKGLTQEQLAEILGVAGRTVSRWENASNMPDLSLLIELAEFYSVEVKEILDGERKNENKDEEIKDTLTKVADYSKEEKNKIARIGYRAYIIAIFTGVAAVLIQFVALRDIRFILGELFIITLADAVAIVMSVHSGLWGQSMSGNKNSVRNDIIVSVFISAMFAFALAGFLYGLKKSISVVLVGSLCFFAVCAVVGFALLRWLAALNKKRKLKSNPLDRKE